MQKISLTFYDFAAVRAMPESFQIMDRDYKVIRFHSFHRASVTWKPPNDEMYGSMRAHLELSAAEKNLRCIVVSVQPVSIVSILIQSLPATADSRATRSPSLMKSVESDRQGVALAGSKFFNLVGRRVSTTSSFSRQ